VPTFLASEPIVEERDFIVLASLKYRI